MKYLRADSGMTLIEVIVAMAIVGILLIVVLAIFSGNLKNIFSAGAKTRNVLQAQEMMDKTIYDRNFVGKKMDVEASPLTLNMKVVDTNGRILNMNVNGIKADITHGDENKVKLTTFIVDE